MLGPPAASRSNDAAIPTSRQRVTCSRCSGRSGASASPSRRQIRIVDVRLPVAVVVLRCPGFIPAPRDATDHPVEIRECIHDTAVCLGDIVHAPTHPRVVLDLVGGLEVFHVRVPTFVTTLGPRRCSHGVSHDTARASHGRCNHPRNPDQFGLGWDAGAVMSSGVSMERSPLSVSRTSRLRASASPPELAYA